MTNQMLGSITMRALSPHATRFIAFLVHEHVAHGGQENGRLGASYRQLVAWGITKHDITLGITEAQIAGFVRLTKAGHRQAGGGDPARYALTWLPTVGDDGTFTPASNEWRGVLDKLAKSGVGDVKGAKMWLRAALREQPIGRKSRSIARKKRERRSEAEN